MLRAAGTIVALLAAVLSAPAAHAQTKEAVANKPVVIGAAIPQTGYLADLAAGMRNALLLWQARVNAGGGLLGRQVDLKLYDDASESERSTRLYELLAGDDEAEVLIGPFGSAATSVAGAVAERYHRVMLNATGTSPEIHKRVFRYLFQVPPAADRSASGVLPLAAAAGLKSVVVVARDEAAAAPLLSQLRASGAARAGGPVILPPAYYAPDAMKGLAPFAAVLGKGGADAVVTPAGFRDAADLVRGFKAAGYAPALFVARGAASPQFVGQVGMDAEYTAGESPYEPSARTPGNVEFVRAYREKYTLAPDFYAACAWAAGEVVEAAVRKAGSFDQDRLRAALASLETPTVLGGYRVAPDGSQLEATPFVMQIRKGRREIVWPEAFRSASPLVPAPGWAQRRAGS